MKAFAERALRTFWAAPILAGGLLWASFPPLDLGGFGAAAGWGVLFLSMRLRGAERSGLQGLLAGLVTFVSTLSWIQPLVPVGWIFTAFWCAAFEGLFALCARPLLREARDGERAAWILAVPALHLLFDAVRTVLASGFPWALPGHAAWKNPLLLGAADVLGVHAGTFAILATGAAFAEVAARAIEGRGRPLRALLPAAATWALLAAWAVAKPAIEERPGPCVLVLQANIPQKLKEDRIRDGSSAAGPDEFWSRQEALAAEGLAAAKAEGRVVDLVVWPETMVPAFCLRPFRTGEVPRAVEYADPDRRASDAALRRVARAAAGRPTLAGVLSAASPEEKYNTALLLDAEGRHLGHQDKQHLTPGGETIPFLDVLPFREEIEEALLQKAGFLPDLLPGDGAALLPLPRKGGEVRVGALICYESIFPDLPREMAADGADLLVNVSNYGWFEGTAEMEQALAIACFRAAETRRSLVLASNNGVSAVIGPDGTVRARTAADERAHLLATVPLASGRTAFVAIGEAGPRWLGAAGTEAGAWSLGAVGAMLALLARRRRTAGPRPGPEGPGTPSRADV